MIAVMHKTDERSAVACARRCLRRPGLVLSLALIASGFAFATAANAKGAGVKVDWSGADLKAVVAGDHRTARYAARDRYRHPYETLQFFGLQPHMKVVEIWPGGGWYTEILAPYLHAHGRYYAAGRNKDTSNPRILRSIKRYQMRLDSRPDIYGKVVVTELSSKKLTIAPAGSADMVLTFRNLHNWMKFGFETAIFGAMFQALKPGGILGVVEHRADPEEFPDPQALSGYVHEEQVIEMAAAAGFKLVGRSDVNANPNDTRRHAKGVWTLPPALRLKDKDRARYIAIGESDRMTLKFIKPAK